MSMSILILLLCGINVIILAIALLWILVPAFFGLPSKPAKPDRIRNALKLANLGSNETLYDLGAGDGRVLLIAAREFGAKAVGIEIGPVQCALIYLRAIASGFSERIQIKLGNFFKAELSNADVVFIYATSQELAKLAPHLAKTMKPNSRVVSISADFPEWEPTTFDDRDLIFLYSMPPKEGNLTTYMLKNTK